MPIKNLTAIGVDVEDASGGKGGGGEGGGGGGGGGGAPHLGGANGLVKDVWVPGEAPPPGC